MLSLFYWHWIVYPNGGRLHDDLSRHTLFYWF
jgi:hypothetical protein